MTTINDSERKDEQIVVRVDRDLEDMIPDFLDNRRNDVVAIRDAAGKEDYETVRVLGHSMKGTGGGYGFDGITEIGAGLEQAAKRKDNAAIAHGLDQLANYLARVEVIYYDEL